MNFLELVFGDFEVFNYTTVMYLEHCTREQLLNIYADYQATEESIKKDVQYLIEWLEKQPHLPKIKGNV